MGLVLREGFAKLRDQPYFGIAKSLLADKIRWYFMEIYFIILRFTVFTRVGGVWSGDRETRLEVVMGIERKRQMFV